MTKITTTTEQENRDLLEDEDKKEYYCIVCGDQLNYSGRGKPPTYCAVHKKSGNSVNNTISKDGIDPDFIEGLLLLLSSSLALITVGSKSLVYPDPPDWLEESHTKEWMMLYNSLLLTPDEIKIISNAITPQLNKLPAVVKYGGKGSTAMVWFPVIMLLTDYANRLKTASQFKKDYRRVAET
jgi:hypothetical protein